MKMFYSRNRDGRANSRSHTGASSVGFLRHTGRGGRRPFVRAFIVWSGSRCVMVSYRSSHGPSTLARRHVLIGRTRSQVAR